VNDTMLLHASGIVAGYLPGVDILRGCDIELRDGEIVGIVGPNGAGKSTLALALGGLVPPAAGSLRAGPELAGGLAPEPHRWRPAELVRRIGSVFQDPRHQFLATTVEDELAIGPRRAGVPAAQIAARTGELLERLRLDRLARANPFTLSGGEQRRLSVATALATRPRLLVLDEPTFGQDARTWAELVDLLRSLAAEGAAIVAATHDEELVAAVADAVVSLGSDVAVAAGDSR
jgi:energy-coupling factor transporter ATP-binding protein EcfA2